MDLYFEDAYVKKDYVVIEKDEDCAGAAYSSTAPAAEDYVEIVRVSVDDMNNIKQEPFNCYLIYGVMLHDPDGMIEVSTKTESVYIVYQVRHIYDANTDTFYHSTPTVIGAKAYCKDEPNDDWNFQCVVYVDQYEKLAVAPDMKQANVKYYDAGESVLMDQYAYAVYFKYDVFICENVKADDGIIRFNDRNYESGCCDDILYRFLAVEGIGDVLAGYRMSIRAVGDYTYDGNGEMWGGVGHLDDVDIMP